MQRLAGRPSFCGSLGLGDFRLELVRPGRAVELAHHLIVVHTNLIQLEELRDRLLIALLGGVQKTTALVHLFFFGVRSGPSFHAIPFAKSAAVPATVENRKRKIAELYQKARRFENAAGRRLAIVGR